MHRALLDRISAKVEAGALDIPAISTAVRQCLTLIRDSDSELAEISAVVQTDPVLSAHVLRHTNSALYGLRVVIDDVGHALAHLGRRRVESLLLEAAMKETASQVGNAAWARAEWQYALCCGALARALGKLAGQDGERCYLMGLLHDLGRIPIIQALEANEALPKDPYEPGQHEIVIDVLHRGVGAQIGRAWDLPPAVKDVISTHLHARLQDEESMAEFPATKVVEAASDTCLAFGLGRVARPFGVHLARSVKDLGLDEERVMGFFQHQVSGILSSLDGLF